VEVLDGLKAGDVIVTAVTDDVKEGAKVQTRELKTEGINNNPAAGQEPNQKPGGPAQYGDQGQTNAKSSAGQQQKGGGDNKNGGKQ
jgi:hypothetical protein